MTHIDTNSNEIKSEMVPVKIVGIHKTTLDMLPLFNKAYFYLIRGTSTQYATTTLVLHKIDT